MTLNIDYNLLEEQIFALIKMQETCNTDQHLIIEGILNLLIAIAEANPDKNKLSRAGNWPIVNE